MRAARRCIAVMALGGVCFLTAGNAAAIAPERPSTNVTAFTGSNRLLPPDPVLRSTQPVLVVVTGFAERATVLARVAGTGFVKYAPADRQGVLRLRFTAGADHTAGQYLMTFQGPARLDVAVPPGGTGGQSSTRGGDQQSITVTVPRIGMFPYRVSDRGGPPGSGAAGKAVSHIADARPRSGLAVTGTDVLGAVLIAMTASLVGVAALRVGRRRSN